MVTREEVKDTALILGSVFGEVSQSMLPFGVQNHELVQNVLEEMVSEGVLEPAYSGSYHYHLASDLAEVLIDVTSRTDLRLLSTNYGPSETDDVWKLHLSTSAGELILDVDDIAARDLWVEVKDVPNLSVGPFESDEIRSAVLDKVLSAEGPLLRHMDAVLSGDEDPLKILGARLESALQSGEIDWETCREYAEMIDSLDNLFTGE